jgi:hypothetical protein
VAAPVDFEAARREARQRLATANGEHSRAS